MYLCIYSSMYLCIYVSMYIRMITYVRMYVYVCTYVYIHVCMHIWFYTITSYHYLHLTWSTRIGCRFQPFMQPQLQSEHLRAMESCNSMAIHLGILGPDTRLASNPARAQVPPETSVVRKTSAAAAWLWLCRTPHFGMDPAAVSEMWVQNASCSLMFLDVPCTSYDFAECLQNFWQCPAEFEQFTQL